MDDKRLRIAYLLLKSEKPMTTREIINKVGCDRKTVYYAIDALEVAGFITEVIGQHKCDNAYMVRL